MRYLVFALLVLLTFSAVLAVPSKNPNFVTKDEIQRIIDEEIAKRGLLTLGQVQQMIDEALGKKPKNLPLDFELIEPYLWIFDPDSAQAEIGIVAKLKNDGGLIINQLLCDTNELQGLPEGISFWGVLHLPSGDCYSWNYDGGGNGSPMWLSWRFDSIYLPDSVVPIPVEIHCFYAGKTWDFNTEIINWCEVP